MELNSQKFPKLNKGIGDLTIEEDPWKVVNEDVSMPAACLILSYVKHNINWMVNYARAFNVQLCPHVKTTMCPKVISLQIEAGLWGVTTATTHQTAVVAHFGIKRILMANQLVGKRNMEIISELLKDSKIDFYCIVDSVENVVTLANFFRKKNKRLNVLLEIGVLGGRTGVRTVSQAETILKAISDVSEVIVIRGVEFYEGLVNTEKEVRELYKRAYDAVKLIFNTNTLSKEFQDEVIISGAGSVWFHIAAEEFSKFETNLRSEGIAFGKYTTLLRPGCYVVHDAGIYKTAQTEIQGSCEVARSLGILKPALKVCAYVQSRPEPTLVILGLGKRDVAVDCGFHIPCSFFKKLNSSFCSNSTLSLSKVEQKWEDCPTHWKVTKIMDQHTFLHVSEEDTLDVGDIVAMDISHPCNTFSSWRQILLVDETYTVLEVLPTYF